MKFIMLATVFQLALMPSATLPGVKKPGNVELFKPFDVPGKTFETENECHSDFEANASTYLQQRGLPYGTSAGYACVKVQQ